MTRLLQWLLDLESIRLGKDAPVSLKWQLALEPWAIFGLAVCAVLLVGFVYHREPGSRGRRILLGTLRLGLIGLVGALLCRPTLVLQRNRVEPSQVVILVDESRSMARSDALSVDERARLATGTGAADDQTLASLSRLDLARAALLKDDAAALRSVPSPNLLHLFGFAAALRDGPPPTPPATAGPIAEALRAMTPDGDNSDVVGAIQTVLRREQNHRLSSIVLISDGQSTTSADVFDLIQLAQAQNVPIHALRVGSASPVTDVAIETVRAPESVFANDVLAVTARISAAGQPAETSVTVRLVDDATGRVLSEQPAAITPGAAGDVELRTRPTEPGVHRLRVEVIPLPDETETANNVELVDVTVADEKLRVLYVDGYPRYEYRFLKTALLRERTVQVSVLLLEADEGFIQEGTDPIRRFPETPEELSRYDLVLFGDVDPRGNWLSVAQMKMILDFVGNEGGGFGLIAGERHAPQRFLGTPLERLIPVRIDPESAGRADAALTVGFHPRLTLEGQSSRLFRFSADRQESEAIFEGFPDLYWFYRTLGPKPGATVLLEHPTQQSAQGPMPLVVTGRYGAGKLFFQATDDTWLWRRHTGEFHHDAYWIQVARSLMPQRRLGQDRRMVIATDRRRYALGERIGVEVKVLDPDVVSTLTSTLAVRLTDAEGAPVARLEVRRLSDDADIFEGGLTAAAPGSFVLAVESPLGIAERPASTSIQVAALDLESRKPEANHELLRQICEGTGGRLIEADELATMMSAIRDRSVQVPDDVTEPLWDSRLTVVLFILIITLEWGLRKSFGMV